VYVIHRRKEHAMPYNRGPDWPAGWLAVAVVLGLIIGLLAAVL
jgi:hypothetical protein